MVSQQLVDQWRKRLADWQRQLDDGRPRPWLARAYVHILSYLLAQYGRSSEGDEPFVGYLDDSREAAEPPRARCAMTLSPAALESSGRPPRTQMEIRPVLESVQAAAPWAEPGPYLGGLRPDNLDVLAERDQRPVRKAVAQCWSKRPRSFRLQFSLRGLLISIVILCVALGVRHIYVEHLTSYVVADNAKVGQPVRLRGQFFLRDGPTSLAFVLGVTVPGRGGRMLLQSSKCYARRTGFGTYRFSEDLSDVSSSRWTRWPAGKFDLYLFLPNSTVVAGHVDVEP